MTAIPARGTVRVAVQSSRRLLRDSLAMCLAGRPDLSVVGKVAGPEELPALCELGRPDTLILDAGSRLSEFIAFADDLLRRFPGLNVIVIYRNASPGDLTLACRAGITSLVPESHGLGAVLALLERTDTGPARIGQDSLTDRERELVMMMSSGHSVAEMALLLGLSPLTVENLKRRVYAKLGVNSSTQAVSRAASLGMLDESGDQSPRPPTANGDAFPVLTVVSGPPCPALDQVVVALLANGLPFVLIRRPEPLADTHWARFHRGPILAALVNPRPADWELVEDLRVPAVVVHSRPLDPPELARALANGANSLVPADRINDHFLSVLRMVSQGYVVVDSMPMRSLIGVVRTSGQRMTNSGELPVLTARESDILQSVARGDSIRQTARALGISPKTVENIQTGLFRKLGVRNRAEAFTVVDGLGLLPDTSTALTVSGDEVTGWSPANGGRAGMGVKHGTVRADSSFLSPRPRERSRQAELPGTAPAPRQGCGR